ncbi:nucleoside 2-deoxyribosyltransferase [Patescibacteria group bacterium]|nr:nucleoside 2-deoxyribosyltransferase [Patescibacteria group bacterium]
MERITVSSSLKFKDLIHRAIEDLGALGIEGLFPNLDSGLSKDDLTLEVMKRLEAEHFTAIDTSDAVYVINPGGYVGGLVAAEIGYAIGKGKPVYFTEETGDLGLDAMATGFIPMGELKKFVNL